MPIVSRWRQLAITAVLTLLTGLLVAAPARAAGDASITVRDGVCDYTTAGLGRGSAASPFQISTPKQLAEMKDCSGRTITVTGATSILSGTQVRYTLDTVSNYLAVGQVVSITGVNPSTLNIESGRIVAADSTSVTFASTVTDAYVSGGQLNTVYHYFELASNINLTSGNTAWNDTSHSVISSVNGDGTTVTYTTSAAHGLSAGQAINIKGVGNVAYSLGNVTVGTVVDSTHFTVANGANAGASSGGHVYGRGWQPIDSLTGSFDGKGHTIDGLTIHSDSDNLGLFSRVNSGTVKNVNFTDAVVDATSVNGWRSLVSVVAAGGDRINFSNIDVAGTITGANRTGFVVGDSGVYGIFNDIHVTGTINVHSQFANSGVNYVGGIGGEVCESHMVDSSANVTINALNIDDRGTPVAKAGTYIGGLAGYSCGGLIDNVTSSGTITGGYGRVGGLFGAYDDSDVHNATTSVDVSYNGEQLDNNDINGIGGAFGELDCCGTAFDTHATGDVTITVPAASGVRNIRNVGGLVGYWGCCGSFSNTSATGNVSITSASTATAADSIGGLVGQLDCCGGVSDSRASGDVTVTLVAPKAATNVGGFGGYGDWGMAYYNDSASGDVTVNSGYNVGGFLGQACCGTSLRYVSATGDVNVTTTSGTNANAGGLIGFGNGNNGTGLLIDQSYATGAVNAAGNSGSQAAEWVGGLIGGISNLLGNTSITNSYYRGSVSGTSKVGGLVGWNSSANGVLAHSYVSATVTATAAGGRVDAVANGGFSDASSTSAYESGRGATSATGVNARSELQMKSQDTFDNLGFTFGGSPWLISPEVNDGYPSLQAPAGGAVDSGSGGSSGGGTVVAGSKFFGSLTFSSGRAKLSTPAKRQMRTVARRLKVGGFQEVVVRSYTGSANSRSASLRGVVTANYMRGLLRHSGIRVTQRTVTKATTFRGKVVLVGFKYRVG